MQDGAQRARSPTYQQAAPRLCVGRILLVSVPRMSAERITAALARIEAAAARIEAAREAEAESKAAGASARVIELVNVHEKLREQVADSLRELDDLLAKLED